MDKYYYTGAYKF